MDRCVLVAKLKELGFVELKNNFEVDSFFHNTYNWRGDFSFHLYETDVLVIFQPRETAHYCSTTWNFAYSEMNDSVFEMLKYYVPDKRKGNVLVSFEVSQDAVNSVRYNDTIRKDNWQNFVSVGKNVQIRNVEDV